MLKEEVQLRTAANNLILLLLTNTQIKQGLESFEALLSMSDFEKRIFENPSAMSAYSEAKDGLFSSFDSFKFHLRLICYLPLLTRLLSRLWA